VTKGLDIGGGRHLPLKFLSLRKVVFGGSGSGKTSWTRVLFEEATEAGVLCGAIDLKGDYWGLKSTADGKGDGIPVVIFGGEHQDVPLDESGGASLADIVVDLRQPFVVDLEELSKGKQLRFLGAFFERLYDRNREPLVLLCDEADRYAPQKPMSPEANVCLGAAEDIAKRGRKHGIFPVFVTQRNASLNKGVSELCDVAIVFRTPGPRDQAAVEDWFGTKATREQRDEVMEKLAGLPTGTAVICSAHPDLKLFATVDVRQPWTFDSSATPEIGKRRIEPKRLAKPDLDKLKTRMAATIEKAKQEDPKELQQALRDVRAELAAAKIACGEYFKPHDTLKGAIKDMRQVALTGKELLAMRSVRVPKRVEVSMLKDAHVKVLEATVCRAEKMQERTAVALGEVIKAAWAMRDRLHIAQKGVSLPVGQIEQVKQVVMRREVQSDKVRSRAGSGDSNLPKGEHAVLTAIAQHQDGVTREQITVLTGYKRSTRDAYLQRLQERGYTKFIGGSAAVTDIGIDALGQNFQRLPTGEGLREYWIRKLPAGEAVVFKVLIDAYPKAVTRDVVTEITGYKRSTRDAYLQRLKTRQLVESDSHGVQAVETLFV
jgi:hypothetical protein